MGQCGSAKPVYDAAAEGEAEAGEWLLPCEELLPASDSRSSGSDSIAYGKGGAVGNDK